MKSKGFARRVNRDDVVRGAADFGADLTGHIRIVRPRPEPTRRPQRLVDRVEPIREWI